LEGEDEARHVLRAPDGRCRAERDEHDVVAVLPERAAFLLHHADDGEAVAVDLDELADGIAADVELLRRGDAEDADALLRLIVERSEEAAAIDPVVEDVLIGAVDAVELQAMARVAEFEL